jgi:hypothetical protein
MFRNISHLLAAVFNDRSRFKRRWNSYKAAPGASEIEGRWQGEWISEVNGHRGELRGIFSKTSDTQYNASFCAVFAKVLKVAYTAPLHGKRVGGTVELEGQTDIGRLAGGIYHYKGQATASDFHCTYRCSYDHGTFTMKRVD